MLLLNLLRKHLVAADFTLLLLYAVMIYNLAIQYHLEEDGIIFQSSFFQGFFLVLTQSISSLLLPLASSLGN